MAGLALPDENQSSDSGLPAVPKDLIREHAAKLFANGYSVGKVARVMLKHLVPNWEGRPEEQNLSQARAKLRRWKKDEKFRDMVYHEALIEVDLDSGKILKGISKKAQRGRVDAARFLFEVTGRHNPKGDTVPTQVVVAINGVPRPSRHSEVPDAMEIPGEVIAEETD